MHMTHYEDISRGMLWDAMHDAVQAGIAAGFEGKKTIEGKTISDWITGYIDDLLGEDDDNQ
jgi:hypothetical protein